MRYMDCLYLFPLCSLCFNSFNGDFNEERFLILMKSSLSFLSALFNK